VGDLLSTFLGFLSSLIEWQNILFTTTVGLGTLLFGVQAFGIFGDHDSDGEHDVDADHDHDVDADHDHDVDADADHDHDVAHAGGGSILTAGLKALGVGRMPISLLLPLALASFGFAGLFASLAFGGIGQGSATFPQLLVLPVLGLAFAGAFATIQIASRLFQKIAPDSKKTSSDKYDLLGLVGVVKSPAVDHEFGQVQLTDNFGRALEVTCVAVDPARAPKYGDEVVLVDWDPAIARFKVVPFSEADKDEDKRLLDGRRRAKALRAAAKSVVNR
jgi:membrane protein implicated in regulation of membrane protease activity